jgi:hypothetical protein
MTDFFEDFGRDLGFHSQHGDISGNHGIMIVGINLNAVLSLEMIQPSCIRIGNMDLLGFVKSRRKHPADQSFCYPATTNKRKLSCIR